MKRIVKKRFIRRGQCPHCKSYEGVRHIAEESGKIFGNQCTQCFIASFWWNTKEVVSTMNDSMRQHYREMPAIDIDERVKLFMAELEEDLGKR